MKKQVYKLGLVAILGLATLMNAQVGINEESPKATLDVTAKTTSGDALEGILVPRVTTQKAEEMGKNTQIQESTLIYIKDNATASTQEHTSEVNGKGFYYFADGKWQKVGGNKKFTARLNQALTTNYDWTDGGKGLVDYYEITSISGAFKLPDPTKHKGAIIHYKNSTQGTITYSGPNGINVPNDTNSITASSAQIIWSDGEKWYLIGGRN